MAKCFLARAVLLFLFVPAVVSGSILDEYYLSKFAVPAQRAKALTIVTPAATDSVERCRTHLYRSLKRDWTHLEPTTQSALAKYVSRPLLVNKATFASPGGHFTIHYATTPSPSQPGSEAPDLTDGDADGVPDWVETVAAVFEEVYQAEVVEMGYRPPPVIKYDVYLRDLAASKTFGLTSDDGAPAFPGTSAASYIEIDRAFTDPIFTGDGRYSADQLLQITAAHEFHHAIQFGYNYYFDFWYAEVTATWIEDEIYDSVNQLYDYLPSYLTKASTLSLDAPISGNLSEYGRWIFNRHLAESYSPAFIKDIWVRLGAMAAPASGNDIPMLPVIDSAIQAGGSTLAADFTGFARRLYLQNWASHAADISKIPVVAAQATYTSFPVNPSVINAKISTLPKGGFAYYTFVPGPTAPAELTLALANVPAWVEVVAIRKGSGGVQEYTFNRENGTIVIPSFNLAGTSEVQLIVASNPESTAATPPARGGGGGGCFIATAAYGSYLHPKVAELRDFRDRFLLTNAPGRLFVSLYYRLSPPVAEVIGKHEWMRGAARGLLLPVILAVEQPVAALAVLLLSGGGLVWRLTRRWGLNRMEPVWSKGGL